MVKNVEVLDEQHTVDPNTFNRISRAQLDIDRDKLDTASEEELEEAGKQILKSIRKANAGDV